MNDPKIMEFLADPANREMLNKIQSIVQDKEFMREITESEEAKALTRLVMRRVADATGTPYEEIAKAEVLLRKSM